MTDQPKRERSFTLADERKFAADTLAGRIAADAIQQRINALPVRVRLDVYRRANAGESLPALVAEAEAAMLPSTEEA